MQCGLWRPFWTSWRLPTFGMVALASVSTEKYYGSFRAPRSGLSRGIMRWDKNSSTYEGHLFSFKFQTYDKLEFLAVVFGTMAACLFSMSSIFVAMFACVDLAEYITIIFWLLVRQIIWCDLTICLFKLDKHNVFLQGKIYLHSVKFSQSWMIFWFSVVLMYIFWIRRSKDAIFLWFGDL